MTAAQFIPDANWTSEEGRLAGRAFLENDLQVVAGMSRERFDLLGPAPVGEHSTVGNVGLPGGL